MSGYPPTSAIGGGIILRRLLAGLESQLLVVCSGTVCDAVMAGGRKSFLECEHLLLRPWRAPRLAGRALQVLNFLRTPFIARRLVPHVRGATVLIVPWAGNLGGELFLAGWLAAVLAGSRLVVYELDDWDVSLDDHHPWIVRTIGHAAHGRLLRRASNVLAISPPAAAVLHARHGVSVEVMASAIEPQPEVPVAAPSRVPPAIVFIGAISGAQADSIARLLRSLALLPYPVQVVLYTDSTPAELAGHSVCSPHLRLAAPVAMEQVLDVLREASALFLPASFLPAQRQLVATSFPTKTAEYLWSGVPVLVHGPPDSVVARLATAEGWGLVADSEDEGALAAAVVMILEDQDVRDSVSTHARRTAAARHELGRARHRIREILALDNRTDGPGAG